MLFFPFVLSMVLLIAGWWGGIIILFARTYGELSWTSFGLATIAAVMSSGFLAGIIYVNTWIANWVGELVEKHPAAIWLLPPAALVVSGAFPAICILIYT